MRFGTGGIPLSCNKCKVLDGIVKINELGLNAMEIEFVYGAYRLPEELEATATKLDVKLSIHGTYFVNLAAKEEEKRSKSINTIINTLKIANHHGIENVVFHPAFYLGRKPEKVYNLVRDSLKIIERKIGEEDIDNVYLRLELMGKRTQFGDPKELVRLSEEFSFVLPCIDFAHYIARYNGYKNNESGFRELLDLLKDNLGDRVIKNMHIHLSDIEYSEKGEKRHLDISDRSDIKWKMILDLLKEYKTRGTIIAETPSLERDALIMQEYYKL